MVGRLVSFWGSFLAGTYASFREGICLVAKKILMGVTQRSREHSQRFQQQNLKVFKLLLVVI